VRDWGAYRERLLAGRSPEEGREQIDDAARSLERTWLGLRTTAGVSLDGRSARARALIDAWQSAGLATLTGERVRLTAEGWLLLDRLSVELDSLDAPPGPSPAG
jgi:oxygen-independent coproporphyrinogen-3 oxidase